MRLDPWDRAGRITTLNSSGQWGTYRRLTIELFDRVKERGKLELRTNSLYRERQLRCHFSKLACESLNSRC
jgi:hypothetical protein